MEMTAACLFDVPSDPAVLDKLEQNFADFVADRLIGNATALADGSFYSNFSLPHVHRRKAVTEGGSPPETPVLRISARNDLSTVSITPPPGFPAGSSAQDATTGAGVGSRIWRWDPDPGSPYSFAERYTVCANDACETAMLDGAIDLCTSTRFAPPDGSPWSFFGSGMADPFGGECFWRLGTTTMDAVPPYDLTRSPSDLSEMRAAHLVFSHRVSSDVEMVVDVSSNSFVDCAIDNFGNCRTVEQWPAERTFENRERSSDVRTRGLKTAILDISDFDGQSGVQVRFRVTDSLPLPGTTDGLLYDIVIVGWETSP